MSPNARNQIKLLLVTRAKTEADTADLANSQIAKAVVQYRREGADGRYQLSCPAHRDLKKWLTDAQKRSQALQRFVLAGPSSRAVAFQDMSYDISGARARLTAGLTEFLDWVGWARRKYSDTRRPDYGLVDLDLRVGRALATAGVRLTGAEGGTFNLILGVALVEAGVIPEPHGGPERTHRMRRVIQDLAAEALRRRPPKT